MPIQILHNNLLYDVSEFAIPFDNTDDEELARPRPWDIGLIRYFMLTVVAPGLWLPFSPLGGLFGLVPLPAAYFAVLAAMLTVYLLLVEFTKRAFFCRVNHHAAS